MDYYILPFSTPNKAIFISLHGIGSTSDPDIYVAFNQYPTRYKYDYSSSNRKGDYIAIIKNSTQIGYYYIGVFGYNASKYAL